MGLGLVCEPGEGRAIVMTVEEALADIERLSGGLARPPLAQQEIPCRDTQQALRLLAEAYGHLRKRDPLYADQRRWASLARGGLARPPLAQQEIPCRDTQQALRHGIACW